jgi:hypothetical protein
MPTAIASVYQIHSLALELKRAVQFITHSTPDTLLFIIEHILWINNPVL